MPPQTTLPPLGRRQRRRYQRSDRREDDRRVERLGRRLVRTARPDGAESAREFLCLDIARPSEGEEPPALIAHHLRHDMGGRAKAVDAETFCVARERRDR